MAWWQEFNRRQEELGKVLIKDVWARVKLNIDDNKTLTDPPKEKEMTKNEQDRMKTLLTGLNDFFEHAGILHHAQHDRVNAVREFLKEKIAEELEEEKRFHVHLEIVNGNVMSIGYNPMKDDPTIEEQKATQEKILKESLIDPSIHKEIVLEPIKIAGLREAPGSEWYVITRCGVYVGPSTLHRGGEHVLSAHQAAKFETPEDAFKYIERYGHDLWGRGIWNTKPEVRKVTFVGTELRVGLPIIRPFEAKKAYVIWGHSIAGPKTYFCGIDSSWNVELKKAKRFSTFDEANQLIKSREWVNCYVGDVEVRTAKYRIKLCDGRWLSCFPDYRPNGTWLHTSHVNEITVCDTKIKPIEFDSYEDAAELCDRMTKEKAFRGEYLITTYVEEFDV